jgi:hypothetical protein
MSELSDRYKQALEIDFIKFSTFIMLGYFLKQFKDPRAELDTIMHLWSQRIHAFRQSALEEYAEDKDVAGILTSIIDFGEGLDRNAAIKEVKEHFKSQMYDILKTF